MPNIQVSESGVLKLLAGLKPSKDASPDGLHPIALKDSGTSLHTHLGVYFPEVPRQ